MIWRLDASAGAVRVCCRTLKIDVPELKKLADVLCEHCADGAGCKIYERRPVGL